MEWLQLSLLIAGAYLAGSIPTGLLVGMLLGRNLLEHGSGKTGATNTLSALGPVAALLVLGIDLIKGMAPVLVARLLPWPGEAFQAIAISTAGTAAIAGHNWSVWVRLIAGRWGGGRGIVPALGAMLLVHPLVVAAAVAAGALALLASRYVVVATIAATLAGVLAAIVLVALQQLSPWLLLGAIAWAFLVIAGFQDNIARLLAGTETRLGHGV